MGDDHNANVGDEQLPKAQHFVPRLLLRRFTHRPLDDYPPTEVYDLATHRRFRTSIRNVAQETHFHNHRRSDGSVESLEPWLDNEVEGPAAAALAGLTAARDVRSMSRTEREVIARFVATLSVRSSFARFEISETPKVILALLEAHGERVATALRAELLSNRDDDVEVHKGVIRDVAEMAPALARQRWLLAEPPLGREFCSSDNPVVRFNPVDLEPYGNGGLLSFGMQLHVALAPDLLLAVLDARHYDVKEGGVEHYSDENLLHYNAILAATARRFLFSRSGDFDVRPGMYQGGPMVTVGDDGIVRTGAIGGSR